MKDYFGIDASELNKKKLWLFDMDGTIYEEENVFDGTLDLLNKIVDSGGWYVFITNNSSKSVADYVKKLNMLGVPGSEDNFFTSAQATMLYLKEKYPHAKVYCQGTKSLVKEMRNADIDVTEEVETVDVVLVGFDMELTTEKLGRTCEILSTQNVKYLATNCDLVCPVSFGYIPDCGSICTMLKNATGKDPIYIGKPEPIMVEYVRNKYGVSKDETVVVGDRLYTDIATGINAGVTTICVLTGEATVKDIDNSKTRPSYTFKSVRELYDSISTHRRVSLSDNSLKTIARSDVIMCEEILASKDERLIKKLCRSLEEKYIFDLPQETKYGKEMLSKMKIQLINTVS